MKENTLYYIEDYIKGMLINSDKNITVKEYKEVGIVGTVLRELLHNNISDLGHRCMSVYRHSFILSGHVYNICLSCGDFYRDDKHFYLKNIEHVREHIKGLITEKRK